jgi:hypothetical protein
MAEQLFTIPLVNVPQRFTIELAGVAYIIVCKWNGEMPAWTLDILDEATSTPLIVNLPLVTGADLLSQFSHVGIPGQLFVYTDGDEFEPPTLDNLGQEANLYYLVNV